MIVAKQQISYQGRLYAAGQTVPIRDAETIQEMLACGSVADTEKADKTEKKKRSTKKTKPAPEGEDENI